MASLTYADLNSTTPIGLTTLSSQGRVMSSTLSTVISPGMVSFDTPGAEYNSSWLFSGNQLQTGQPYFNGKSGFVAANANPPFIGIVPTPQNNWQYNSQTGNLTLGNRLFCSGSTPGTIALEPIGQGFETQPQCQLIDANQIVDCCTYSGSLTDPQLTNHCGPSYLPGPNGQNGICIPFMSSFCGGTGPSGPNWTTNPICQSYLSSAQHNNPTDLGTVVANTVASYTANNPYSATDPFFTTVIPQICSAVPGACDTQLNSLCSSSGYADLEQDAVLQKLCGCHLPQTAYQYTLANWNSRQCDPICTLGAIPAGSLSSSGWTATGCTSSTCLINDYTSAASPTAPCGNCGGSNQSGCSTCYLTSNSSPNVNATVCSQCIDYGSSTVVPCPNKAPSSTPGWLLPVLIVAGVVLGLILLALVIYLLVRRSSSPTKPT